jgi:hypothetical protein
LHKRRGNDPIVENRPGAGTNIATEAVVRAAPDGYTLLLVTGASAINATLYEKLNFNFIRDIAPVGSIIHMPIVMMVHPSFQAKTVAEFIAYAKANPGKINMANPGTGTGPHVRSIVQDDGWRRSGRCPLSRRGARDNVSASSSRRTMDRSVRSAFWPWQWRGAPDNVAIWIVALPIGHYFVDEPPSVGS